MLTALVAASFGVVVLLNGRVHAARAEAIARQRYRLPAPDHSLLTFALAGAVVVLVVLLALVCAHAYRIATLTFADRRD